MKKITTLCLILFTFLAVFNWTSCTSDIDSRDLTIIQHGPYYSVEDWEILSAKLDLPELPDSYNGFGNSFSQNAIPTLGRVLFYDKNLSKDRSVSCASCHEQSLAFSDDEAFSRGIEDRRTDRNSLPLGSFEDFQQSYNSSVFDRDGRFFWDERVGTLHEQMEQTIPNAKEMGLTLEEMQIRLRDLDYIRVLYRKAFKQEVIQVENVLEAISQFVNSIKSTSSRFDGGFGQGFGVDPYVAFSNFTQQENLGKQLFLDNCGHCHAFSLSTHLINQFQNLQSRANNGLDLVYADKGVGEQTNAPEDDGVFKIPGLRNVELTGPYMHDGRFETLEEVVEHYSTGIKDHENLDERLRHLDGSVMNRNFSDTEKDAIVAFLKTLTDYRITEEIKWSDPFK